MSNDQAINTALWNFCMKANDGPHRSEDGEAPAPLPPRDPKDLEWLKTVMESMEMPDKTMKRVLKEVHRLDAQATKKASDETPAAVTAGGDEAKKSKDDSPQAGQEETMSQEELIKYLIEGPLDELQELVEDLNFAKEFELMKGPETILYKLDGPSARGNAELRTMLFLTIAHASQNLPDLQESFSKLEWARQLVPMLRDETNGAACAANILACSSMCRGSAKASGEFVNGGGFDALFTVLSRNVAASKAGEVAKVDVKSCTRAIRLLDYFLQGKVSSVQILEQVAQFVLPLDQEESAPQEDLRNTATTYVCTFFELLQGVGNMADRAKVICREILLKHLESTGQDSWSDSEKKLVGYLQ